MSYGFKVIIEADYALFTRPEQKVERASYDVPTPSALEGVLKSVYWKPAIRYVIDNIVVFNQIKYANIRRNEVKYKASMARVKAQMKGDDSPEIFASEDRSQRSSMMLTDVKYGVEFHFELTGLKADREDEGEEKHFNIIKRRLEKGQCFKAPYLGTRECGIKSIALVEEFDLSTVAPELKGDIDLGLMLYGMKFADGGIPIGGNWNSPQFSDKADAVFYHPHMIDGIIDVKRYRGDIDAD